MRRREQATGYEQAIECPLLAESSRMEANASAQSEPAIR